MGFKELRRNCKINDKWKSKCSVCQLNEIEISKFSKFEKSLCSCDECKVDFIFYVKEYRMIESK